MGNWSTYGPSLPIPLPLSPNNLTDLCISTLDPDYLAESTRDNGQLVRSFMAYPNCAELADPADWRYSYDERSNVMQAHFRSNVTGVPTNVEMGMIKMGAARGFECVVV